MRFGCQTQLIEARDPQHNYCNDVSSRNFINLDGGLFLLEGDTTTGGLPALANVSLNHFENCGALFYDGVAFDLRDTDHNFIINCRAFRHGAATTGVGIALHGSNNGSANQLTARSNTFIGFSGGTQIFCYTTATYTNPSGNNTFIALDHSNNTPFPTQEDGSTTALPPFAIVLNQTNLVGPYFGSFVSPIIVAASTIANAQDSAIDGRVLMTTESMRIRNRAANNLVLDRPNSTNETVEGEWGINVVAAAGSAGENLRIVRAAGTGIINLGAGVGYIVTNSAGSPTLTVSNGGHIIINATAANRTITLPLIAAYGANITPFIRIRRLDSSGFTVTIAANAADTIVGTATIAGGGVMELVADATSIWYANTYV
jgi:hypothetical protein